MYKIKFQRDFFETCKQMGKVIRSFRWHQNFVPWGLSATAPAPAPGLYTCIKSWKKCINSDFKYMFFKLATNEWNDKTILLTSKLCPLGAVCPCPRTIYMYKIMKINIWNQTSRRFCRKLQQMIKVTESSCWHKNFVPKGLSAPAPGLYICIKSLKKCIKSDVKEIYF